MERARPALTNPKSVFRPVSSSSIRARSTSRSATSCPRVASYRLHSSCRNAQTCGSTMQHGVGGPPGGFSARLSWPLGCPATFLGVYCCGRCSSSKARGFGCALTPGARGATRPGASPPRHGTHEPTITDIWRNPRERLHETHQKCRLARGCAALVPHTPRALPRPRAASSAHPGNGEHVSSRPSQPTSCCGCHRRHIADKTRAQNGRPE